MTLYTLTDVLDEMERQVRKAGSCAAFAKRAGVTPGFITHIRVGRRNPTGAVLRALGFEESPMYRRRRALSENAER